MRMKKLLAAALACCTALSAVSGTAVFAADTEESAAPELLFDFQSSEGKNSVSIMESDAAERDHALQLKLYIPSNPGVNGISLKMQVNDGELGEDHVFGNYGFKMSDAKLSEPYCFDSENEGNPLLSFQQLFTADAMNLSWVYRLSQDENADSSSEAGTTSWDSDVSWAYDRAFAEMTLTVPKGTPAGDYVLDIRRDTYVNSVTLGGTTEWLAKSTCTAAEDDSALAFSSKPFTVHVVDPTKLTYSVKAENKLTPTELPEFTVGDPLDLSAVSAVCDCTIDFSDETSATGTITGTMPANAELNKSRIGDGTISHYSDMLVIPLEMYLDTSAVDPTKPGTYPVTVTVEPVGPGEPFSTETFNVTYVEGTTTAVEITTTSTEETTTTESTTSTEETTTTESTTSTEETTTTESTTSTEKTTSTESTTSTEKTTSTESTTSTEKTTSTESTTSTEKTTSTESTTSTEKTTSTESTTSTEKTTSTESATSTEETTSTESTTSAVIETGSTDAQSDAETTTTTDTTSNETPDIENSYADMAEGMYMVAGDVSGKPGEKVKVPIYVYNDPGTAGMALYWVYSDGLTVSRIERGNAYLCSAQPSSKTVPISFVFTCPEGKDQKAEDGSVICYISFTIPETAADGKVYKIEWIEENGKKIEGLDKYSEACNTDRVNNRAKFFPGTITVNAKGEENPRLNYEKYSFVKKGEQVKLAVLDAKGTGLKWSSSDEAVATVGANGVVTAQADTGDCTITAEFINGSGETVSLTCQIHIGLFGDVDGDGVITPYDATLVLIAFSDLTAGYTPEELTLTAEEQIIADVDLDGAITAYDATMILTYSSLLGAGFDDVTWYELIGNPDLPDAP